MNRKDSLLLVGVVTASLLLKISSLIILCAVHVHAEEPHTHEEIEHILVTGKREMKREMPL